MKTPKILLIAAISIAPIAWTPAVAANDDWDAKDAYYLSCTTEFVSRNMGNPDQAAAFCYPKAYGNEQTGGGAPNTYTYPVGGESCYGQTRPCNPHFRPR